MRSPCLKCPVHLIGESKAGHPQCEICKDRVAYADYIENRLHDLPVIKCGGETMSEITEPYGKPETKVCRRCGQDKPIKTAFSKHPETRDGYDATCKACKNEMQRFRAMARKAEMADFKKQINEKLEKKIKEKKDSLKQKGGLVTEEKNGKVVIAMEDPVKVHPRLSLVIDFAKHQELLKEVQKIAEREIRTDEQQALFFIKNGVNMSNAGML